MQRHRPSYSWLELGIGHANRLNVFFSASTLRPSYLHLDFRSRLQLKAERKGPEAGLNLNSRDNIEALMAGQDTSMEEILWRSPPHVQMMGGYLHSNNSKCANCD